MSSLLNLSLNITILCIGPVVPSVCVQLALTVAPLLLLLVLLLLLLLISPAYKVFSVASAPACIATNNNWGCMAMLSLPVEPWRGWGHRDSVTDLGAG